MDLNTINIFKDPGFLGSITWMEQLNGVMQIEVFVEMLVDDVTDLTVLFPIP